MISFSIHADPGEYPSDLWWQTPWILESMSLTNVNNAAPLTVTLPHHHPFQLPTTGTIVAISIMNVVLLVGNHILYSAAPLPTCRLSALNALVSLQSYSLKKNLTPTCFPSLSLPCKARLLTPTPILSAPFKSKQKTHLVCLLPPFSPL